MGKTEFKEPLPSQIKQQPELTYTLYKGDGWVISNTGSHDITKPTRKALNTQGITVDVLDWDQPRTNSCNLEALFRPSSSSRPDKTDKTDKTGRTIKPDRSSDSGKTSKPDRSSSYNRTSPKFYRNIIAAISNEPSDGWKLIAVEVLPTIINFYFGNEWLLNLPSEQWDEKTLGNWYIKVPITNYHYLKLRLNTLSRRSKWRRNFWPRIKTYLLTSERQASKVPDEPPEAMTTYVIKHVGRVLYYAIGTSRADQLKTETKNYVFKAAAYKLPRK